MIIGAVVVIKLSACSRSTLTIRVRIPLKSTIFLKIVFQNNENKQKEAEVGPFKKEIVTIITAQCVVSKALWQTINFVLSKALWPVINIPDWINGYFGHNKQARLN